MIPIALARVVGWVRELPKIDLGLILSVKTPSLISHTIFKCDGVYSEPASGRGIKCDSCFFVVREQGEYLVEVAVLVARINLKHMWI